MGRDMMKKKGGEWMMIEKRGWGRRVMVGWMRVSWCGWVMKFSDESLSLGLSMARMMRDFSKRAGWMWWVVSEAKKVVRGWNWMILIRRIKRWWRRLCDVRGRLCMLMRQWVVDCKIDGGRDEEAKMEEGIMYWGRARYLVMMCRIWEVEWKVWW